MRTLLISCIMMLTSIASWGAKAYTGPYVYTQPDGTQISLTLHGDEYFSYFTTSDGVIVVREKSGVYLAKIDENGDITSSGVLAHNNGLRTAEEIEIIKSQNLAKYFEGANAKSAFNRVPMAGGNPAYTPHKGSPKIVVILAQFQDVKFSVNEPQKAFDEYFNATGEFTDYGNENKRNYGSIAQYFSDMSNGAFTPQFEVVGPVTLSKSLSYYGGTAPGTSNDNSTSFVTESIDRALEAGLVDFSKAEYDIDNNGEIDLVYIIYAGYMENMGGPAESIWAKASYTTKSVNGKKIRRFCMSSEKLSPDDPTRIASIGVTCHEFSHCMGLPDLYVKDAIYFNDNQEMEYWDLMDGGEYVYNGYVPAAYTAWEKEAMGWIVNIKELKESKDTVIEDISIPTLENGTAYRIVNPKDATEYIMLENIQRSGWNSRAYVATGTTGGILAYHMKYPSKTVNSNDYPNARLDPSIAVIPADGLVESYDFINSTKDGVERTENSYYDSLRGDLFNLENGTELYDDLNLPNFCWYTGTDLIDGYSDRYQTNKRVEFIFDGSTITLKYVGDVASGISNVKASETDSKAYYSIDGQYLGTDKGKLKPGIYISNKKKVIIR